MITQTITLRNEVNATRVWALLKNWRAMLAAGKPVAVTITEAKSKRSLAQNALLHVLLTQLAEQVWVEGRQYNVEAWKELVRQKFIGTEEVDLPNGSRQERGISTTTLDVGAFNELLTQLQAWMIEEYGIEMGIDLP